MFNTKARYGVVAQLFHWTIAILILALIPMGLYMHELPEVDKADIDQKIFLYSLHKSIGLIVFFLAIARIVWAFLNPRPAPLHPERKLETFTAESVHWILYISIIGVPLSGWLHHAATDGFAPIWLFSNQDLPFIPNDSWWAMLFGITHYFLAMTLIASLVLHIAGALKHAIVDRDQTLSRMLPGRRVDVALPGTASHSSAMPALLAFIVFMVVMSNSFIIMSQRTSVADSADAPEANSGNWQIRADESRLSIEVQQMGAPVSGYFASWNADIRFNPDQLGVAKVTARIDVRSLTLGSVSERALSDDFLAAEQFSDAVFTSDEFLQVAEARYQAIGMLDLRGNKMPVTIDFELTIDDDVATMSGQAIVNRMDFGVGAAGFADENTVAFPVKIDIKIVADRMEQP